MISILIMAEGGDQIASGHALPGTAAPSFFYVAEIRKIFFEIR